MSVFVGLIKYKVRNFFNIIFPYSALNAIQLEKREKNMQEENKQSTALPT